MIKKLDKERSRSYLKWLYFLIVVVFGVIIVISIQMVIRKMEDSAVSTSQYLLEQLRDNLSYTMKGDSEAIAYFADTLDVNAPPAELQRDMAAFKENYGFLEVAVLGQNQEGYSSTGEVFRLPDQEVLEGGAFTGFSNAFHGGAGVWETDYRAPIVRDGAEAGAVYVRVPLNKYGADNAMTYYGGQGMAYLFDVNTKKMVLMPTTPNLIMNYMSEIDMMFTELGFDKTLMDTSVYPAIAGRERLVLQGQLDGERVYITLLPMSNQESWYICGIVPESAVLQEASLILQILFGVMAGMGVVMLLVLAYVVYESRCGARRKQEQLQEAELQNAVYDTVGDASDTILCVFNRERQTCDIVFHNIMRILGVDGDSLMADSSALGMLLNSLVPGLYGRMLRGEIDAEEVIPLVYDHPVRHERRNIRLTVEPLNIEGRACYMLMMEDITEDMKIQMSLRTALENANQANQAKSDFLSRMSHDIRTPINAIIGMREIAVRHLDEPEKISDCLGKIEVSSRHLLELVNDILDLSKIESGKLSLRNDPFNLTDCVADVMSIIKPQAHAKGQRLTLDAERVAHEQLIGDDMRLQQILINLLSNSVKYTQEGGEIALTLEERPSTRRTYSTYVFTVRDNGVGMSAEFIEKIGKPFEQETNIFHKSELGSGLGLSIVKNLVSLKGGTLDIESEKGQGTTTRVELTFEIDEQSRQSGAKQPGADEQFSTESLKGRRVLVVEDNALNREIAVELLQMQDMAVETAVDGRDAVAKFKESSPGHYDLILMDLQMPGMDGCEATRIIRGLSRDDASVVPIVAMTANAFSEDVSRCRRAGMNAHLSKPIELDAMYACLVRQLEKRPEKN